MNVMSMHIYYIHYRRQCAMSILQLNICATAADEWIAISRVHRKECHTKKKTLQIVWAFFFLLGRQKKSLIEITRKMIFQRAQNAIVRTLWEFWFRCHPSIDQFKFINFNRIFCCCLNDRYAMSIMQLFNAKWTPLIGSRIIQSKRSFNDSAILMRADFLMNARAELIFAIFS